MTQKVLVKPSPPPLEDDSNVFDVNEYKMKNKWPSIELLFETGVWLFMVSLVAVAFGSMIANYWTNLRKTSADRLKPQLIDKAENTFDELIRTFIEEPQNDNINKFDQTLADFTRMLSIIVAQQQEALEIAEQQEARSEAAECGNTACQSL
uniref:Uncharacterized protein n=1 Tax=Ipomoea trifida TaxID=35884 RepID=A0A942_IPOTF|nr:hypothetical protein [Ipomoea trifida]